MGFDTKVTDWEALGICQIGGALIAGMGIWFFNFRSKEANVDVLFNLIAGGGGLGGSIGGGTAPDFSGNLVYTKIDCQQPFSLYDLNNAGGMVLSSGMSVVVGYSVNFVGASKLAFGGALFGQLMHGLVFGVGEGAFYGFGGWTHMKQGVR